MGKGEMISGFNKDTLYYLLDLMLGSILALVSMPLFILAAILVKLDSKGPIFYIQDRYGKDKKIFRIYKFRTMDVGAEKDQPIWGKEADPRSKKFGKFLRVTHLDELPQLLNIFKGEMSLVGPRPERPFFAQKFNSLIDNYDERFEIKPGLTGWAQINGFRGESSVDERSNYDRFYIQNQSLFFYLKIIFLTPIAKPVQKCHSRKLSTSYDRFISHEAEIFLPNMPLEIPSAKA